MRRDDQIIDMDAVAKQAEQVKPKLIIAGGIGLFALLGFQALSARSPTASALICWWTWRISPASSPAACMPRRCRMPMSPPRRRTSRCAARAAALILSNDEALAKKLNSAIFPGLQGGPLMHVIAAKAVAFAEALRPDFKVYARNVVENAKALAETLRAQGFDIVSGGTDNHLMLVDLRPKGLKGNVSEKALVRAGHHLQQERHSVRSREAVRHLGHPSRHARRRPRAASASPNSSRSATLIAEVLNAVAQSQDGKAPLVEAAVKERVKALTDRFPIYQ